MGAFPSQNSASRLMETENFQGSPNLFLAKKMINRSQADNRRRRAIEFDNILEEGESVHEIIVERSLFENHKSKSSFGEFSSPSLNSTLDFQTSEKTTPDIPGQKIYTNTVSLQTDILPTPSVSVAIQTDDFIIETPSIQSVEFEHRQDNCSSPVPFFSNSVSIQTDRDQEYHCGSSATALKDSSSQTGLSYNAEECNNIRILVQTTMSEDELVPVDFNGDCDKDGVVNSLGKQHFSMQTQSQSEIEPRPRIPVILVDAQVQAGNEWNEITLHDMSSQVETGELRTASPVLEKSVFIQTENIHDIICPTIPDNITIDSSFQTENITTVDSYCSPLPIRDTNLPLRTDCYLEVGTETDVILPLETLDVETQTESDEIIQDTPVVLDSMHTFVQTDNPETSTADTSANTSLLTNCFLNSVSLSTVDTQTDAFYLRRDFHTQTDTDSGSNNLDFSYVQTLESEKQDKFTAVSPPLESVHVQTSFNDKQEIKVQDSCSSPIIRELTSTQSQTELEISEVILEPNSAPMNSTLDDIIDHAVQTEDIPNQATKLEFSDLMVPKLKELAFNESAYCLCSAENCSCYLTYMEQNSHYQSTLFNLREKMYEITENNEELTVALAAKDEELELKGSMTNHQDSFREFLELLIGGDSESGREKCFQSLRKLTGELENQEMCTLLESLSDHILSLKENKPFQLNESNANSEQSDREIEALRLMMSEWSEKDFEQLPHYLYSVQTKIQNLNGIIKSKETLISELRSEIENAKLQLRENIPSYTYSNSLSEATQTSLPPACTQFDEVGLEEITQLKNSNEQLGAQLSQSEVRNREYAALLVELQDDSPKPETKDSAIATEQIRILSLEEVSNFESQLKANNVIMKHLEAVRGELIDPFPSGISETFVGYSDLEYHLDQVSQLLKFYTCDLELLKESDTSLTELREEICSCQETNSKNTNGMLKLLETEKIAHENTQANLNSALDQITDLFKANDNAEQQLEQMKLEAEKMTLSFKKKIFNFEEKLNQANKVYAQNEQLRAELDSLQSLHSDCVSRRKVEEVANHLVELERDNSSLHKEVGNLTAIRSNLEGTISHLKTEKVADKFDLSQVLREERENSLQLSSRISEVEGMLIEKDKDADNLKSEIKMMSKEIENKDVTVRERDLEILSTKAILKEKSEDFDELLKEFRARKKYISVLREVQIPELDDDLTAMTKERDSLKESLIALEEKYKEKDAKLSSFQKVTVSSDPVDKLNRTELITKCNHYEKQIWNLRRNVDCLEEQCRQIERRRQLEVSAMPKHDFLSLRADKASLKSQARSYQNIHPKHNTDETPLEPMKNEPKAAEENTNNCAPQ